jgi:hypothetical protein
MKNNLTFIPENSGPELNKISRTNGYSKVKNSPDNVNYADRKSVNDTLLLELSDMKKANAGLVDLLEQRTSELAEFVAATTHSFQSSGMT